MNKNPAKNRLARLATGVGAIGAVSLLLAATLTAPAGAVAGPPFNTTVTVTSSALTAVTGQPMTFSAKVVSAGHGVPGGQVVFTIVANDASTVSCDTGNTLNLTAGTAACVVASGLLASAGPYSVAAAYTDTLDSNYKPGAGSRSQNVNQGKTTTSVTASASPSVTGQAITFTAAVAPTSPASGAPSGTVTFAGVTCDGGNTIAIVAGLAQCPVSAGMMSQSTSYAITGAYSGDALFLTSSGIAHQLVKTAATVVVITPSTGTCTGSVCSIGQGTAIAFTAVDAATGTDGGSGVPAGTAVFSITRPGSNASLPCDGGSNSIALVGGQATCTMSAGLSASIYFKVTATVTAAGYTTSSATLYENSALASTNVVTSVPKNIGTGQTFDVTAVVTPTGGYSGSNLPTGYVNILVCGSNSNGNNGCQGGASPVGPGGVAKLTIGGGEYIGSYSYQAVYTGDSNFYSSTARSKFIFIGKSPTAVSLSESGGFWSYDGNAVAITATVAATNGAAGSTLVGPPTGDVTFTITGPNGPVTCAGGNTVPLSQDVGQVEGSVSCFLPPGTLTNSTPPATDYRVQVNYAGDWNYTASNGRAVQVVVPMIA